MAGTDIDRRLTAIVAADVVGYSRLVAVAEDATLAGLRSLRAEFIDGKIADYRGRIANTAGDSLLIEFPSVFNALRCAVDLQRGIAARNAGIPADHRIQFRMGVNLGDVVEQDGDLLGDGVNVAARLEGIAEPGGICISAVAHDQVQGRFDIAFEDLGRVPLKNIPAPVHAYRVSLDGKRGTGLAWRRRLRTPLLAAGAALLLVVGGSGLWWFQPWDSGVDQSAPAVFTPEDKPSIVVLPFTNMSDDTQQEYFSDGVTEDLITDLSKISGLFVIARNTAFTYKGRAANLRDVSLELGVRYVLEGSVRKAGDRVRISAQLIDAKTGGHVWADRFDREFKDIFGLQDDVTQEIVSALALELTSDERTRLSRSDPETSPEVYDLYLRGTEALRQFTPESIEQARTYFLRALSLDPDYARAHATMAFTYTASGIFFRSVNVDEAVEEALRYGERALELNDALPQGHFAMAIAWLRQGRHEEALAAARKAIEYDPNYSDGYAALSNILFFAGDGQQSVQMMRQAMRLNPRYSAAYIDILGRAYYIMGEYDRAIEEEQDCIERDPTLITCHVFLAVSLARAGQIEEAEWHAQEVLALEPEFTLETDSIAVQFKNSDDRERYREALRKAGIPEK